MASLNADDACGGVSCCALVLLAQLAKPVQRSPTKN